MEGSAAVVREAIEAAAPGVEVLAVAVIVIAIVFGTGRFLLHLAQGRIEPSSWQPLNG